MAIRRAAVVVLLTLLLACASAAQSVPAPGPRNVDLSAPDGTTLKATYFAATKPGPGVLLLHQCNRDRKSWDVLAQDLAAAGMNVLTFDLRGFGESGGTRNDKLTPEEGRKIVAEVWPRDVDTAFEYLLSQPGVTRERIGAGGASCGVNNAIQLARRHPEVKALVLLAGDTDREGRLFLQSSKNLPVFTGAADDDEFGNFFSDMMQWYYSLSSNPASRFAHYATGKHGAEMFAEHKELPHTITAWFAATLMNKPETAPQTNGSRLSPTVLRTLEQIATPSGATQAAKNLAESRRRDPNAKIFPEFIVNLLGYEHLQAGDNKGAVEIMKLNVAGYPDSPNVYDSLSDAYLADGQKELALQNAKKALELLAKDTTDPENRRKAIRDSAERKVKQLDQQKQ